jgi:hypothetical protein
VTDMFTVSFGHKLKICLLARLKICFADFPGTRVPKVSSASFGLEIIRVVLLLLWKFHPGLHP